MADIVDVERVAGEETRWWCNAAAAAAAAADDDDDDDSSSLRKWSSLSQRPGGSRPVTYRFQLPSEWPIDGRKRNALLAPPPIAGRHFGYFLHLFFFSQVHSRVAIGLDRLGWGPLEMVFCLVFPLASTLQTKMTGWHGRDALSGSGGAG